MWLLSGFCLRWVSFRFKFKVLCTYSVFILLATLFFFSMIPSGLLIKITWKETPRRRTPPHLTRTHCHTRADTRRHARASCTQGREPGDLGQCCATQAERGGAKPWAPPAGLGGSAISSAPAKGRLLCMFRVAPGTWLPIHTRRIRNVLDVRSFLSLRFLNTALEQQMAPSQ